MWWKTLGTVLAITFLVTVPALAEQPFGYFEGNHGGGEATGEVTLLGWALDDDGVESVEIFADGERIGRAVYGHRRDGVEARYPGYPDARYSGFHLVFDSGSVANGERTVSVRVTSGSGETQWLNEKLISFSNEMPFGYVDGLQGGGNGATGTRAVTGWGLDDDGVGSVDILVDGNVAGRAGYGLPRADVEARFPGYPDSALAGFGYTLNTTHYLNGTHTVAAEVTNSLGTQQTILAPMEFQFTNTTHMLTPFGEIEFPNDHAELGGTCNPLDITRMYSVVSGYALDAGVESGDTGVGYVELLIDGSIFANSRRDCFYADATGGLTNCYGLQRLDIEQIYPDLPDGPHAGFRFVMDVGALIDFGFAQGSHVLTIRAGDVKSQMANIHEIHVDFFCNENIPNQLSFGAIDPPPLWQGTASVSGWALDWEGVSLVQVYVDGTFIGLANYGLSRLDIWAMYPGYPDSLGAGFNYALDTTQFSQGEHDVQVLVTDVFGNETMIGELTFTVAN